MADLLKPTILVAEDDEALRELIVTKLEGAGYRTLQACHGIKALDIATTQHADGMILDIGMPRLDGFGVLNALRSSGKTGVPPVMVLTARNAVDDMQRAMQLGAKDYMTKPFDDARLLVRVARLTRAAQRRTDVSAPGTY